MALLLLLLLIILFIYLFIIISFKDIFFIMKNYEKILSMDQKCIINMVKNFNEKSQLYNYMRNVIVDDNNKKNVGIIWIYGIWRGIIIIIITIIVIFQLNNEYILQRDEDAHSNANSETSTYSENEVILGV